MGRVKGLLLGLVLNTAAPAHGGTEQQESAPAGMSVHLEVVAESEALVAQTTWLGEERSLSLEEGPPGVWTGQWSGEEVRFLPISLEDASAKAGGLRYAGLEVLPSGDHTLRYSQVSPNRFARAATSASPLPVQLGWLALVAGLCAWMTRREEQPAPEVQWKAWWSPLFWLAVAVAWTWPAASGALTGRGFDAPGTAWVLGAAGRFDGLRDALSAWPVGGNYTRMDSFLILPLGRLGHMVDPTFLHGLVALFGVALSGWCAELAAVQLGARRPWAWVAGSLFALSGTGAWALLEGHTYHALAFWLPLMLWALWRATSSNGRALDGALGGLAFGGALLTTGYLGLAAGVLATGLVVAALVRREPIPVRGLVGAAATALPIGGLYTWHWSAHDLSAQHGEATHALVTAARAMEPEALRATSAHLRALLGSNPQADLSQHSLSLALSAVMIGLVVCAPKVLKGPSRRALWPLLITGLAGLVLAMGPAFSTDGTDALFPLPMAAFQGMPLGEVLRFPARLTWVTLAAWAPLAALVLYHLSNRTPRLAWLLLGLAMVEPFVRVDLPGRQQARPTGKPTAYQTVTGPVLDLFPEARDADADAQFWFSATACQHQLGHGLPIAEDCVSTPVVHNPRVQIGRWLVARLLSGEHDQARQGLEEMGFSGVALHPDLFSSGDRARLQAALSTFDGTPAISTDGGEHIQLYRLAGETGEEDTLDAFRTRVLDSQDRGIRDVAGVGAAGQEGLDYIKSLRVEALARALPPDSALVLRFGSHIQKEVLLTDDGSAPADVPSDGVWTGHWARPLPGRLQARLELNDTPIWEGELRLVTDVERLVFRVTDGRAEPVVVAAASAAP